MAAARQHNFAIAVIVVIFRDVEFLWEGDEHTFIGFVASRRGSGQGQRKRGNGLSRTTGHHRSGIGGRELG